MKISHITKFILTLVFILLFLSSTGEGSLRRLRDLSNVENKCKQEHFSCNEGRNCIHERQLCDGMPNCEDHTDENNSICKTRGYPGWCALPNITSDKTYQLHKCLASDPFCGQDSGDLIPPGTMIIFRCKADNIYFGSLCLLGKWDPPLVPCKPSDYGYLNEIVEQSTHMPWQVKIFERVSPQPICGGVIVSPYAIISAAHCVYNVLSTVLMPPSSLYVTAGKSRDLNESDPIGIRKFWFPPRESKPIFGRVKKYLEWPVAAYVSDIVVIELASKINFTSPDIAPIGISDWRDMNFNGGRMGIISEYQSSSQEMAAKKVTWTNCQQYSSHMWRESLVFSDKICFMNEVSIDENYNGGIGFYSLTNMSTNYSQYMLRGIFSSTFHYDTDQGYVSVLTDVINHSQWLYEIMNEIKKKYEPITD